MSFGFGIGGMILGGVASLGMGMWGASEAKQAAQDAKEREDKAREEMDRLKEVYAGLDTSNPFLNMENTMEDLTINQKQSQFQAQQFAQSQANIMQGLRGATGGSGIKVYFVFNPVPVRVTAITYPEGSPQLGLSAKLRIAL